MILQFLMFVQLAASLHLPKIEDKFMNFMVRFNKQYQVRGEEYFRRLQIYSHNLEEIKLHNAGPRKWKMAENQFSDMTAKEFNDIYGTGYLNVHLPDATESSLGRAETSYLPGYKDWRKEGVITAVKNQGHCGSCWAHAGTEQLESYLKLETRVPLTNLSVQQVISCAPNPMNCGGEGGCGGGIAQLVYNYAESIGVVSDEEYPYRSGHTAQTESCYYNPSNQTPIAFVRGHETLPHNDYYAILSHIANVGPLAVNVDASRWRKGYTGGVFDSCSYGHNINLNHLVQLVGYGTDSEQGDYWLVRNSWGSSWGESGYIRLLREHEVKCGIDATPLKGVGCQDDGVHSQKVCGMCGILFQATYPIGTQSYKK